VNGSYGDAGGARRFLPGGTHRRQLPLKSAGAILTDRLDRGQWVTSDLSRQGDYASGAIWSILGWPRVDGQRHSVRSPGSTSH
jgi:hypothetical protein